MLRLAQSPRDPGFVQDPYPFYEAARLGGPMFWWEDYEMPAAVGHAEVQSILRSRAFARVPPPQVDAPVPWDDLPAFKALEDASMLSNEAPRHPVLRRAVVAAFTSARIEALSNDIEALCHDLIDGFPDQPFDLIEAYATPIPVRVIARMLGESEDLCPRLLDWSHAMVRLYTANPSARDRAAAEAASAAFTAHLDRSLAHRTPDPQGDLAAALLAEAEAGRMTEAEVRGTVVLLLNAGHEATVHAIGNAVALLARRSDATALCAPENVAATVEECLRLDPPLHLFDRWVIHDIELAGHRFRTGDRVACLLGAANRDPTIFPEPDAFRPGRDARALTSFGAGVHFCLGAPLARMEMQIALRVLFERCPDLRLTAPVCYSDIYHFHGLGSLMVKTTLD